MFFQLIASRYEQGSVLVTSTLPFGRWGETFSDDVVAAAMIDHLVYHAEVLTLTGDSYRTRQKRELLRTLVPDTGESQRPPAIQAQAVHPSALGQAGQCFQNVDRGLGVNLALLQFSGHGPRLGNAHEVLLGRGDEGLGQAV